MSERIARRVIDAGLNLLDRQILDSDGRMAGTVDDLELTQPAKGDAPIVTAILSGPGALAQHIGGRIGAWVESVHSRLHPSDQPGPARISFGVVKKISNSVELTVPKSELDVSRFEDWARDLFIKRIPGGEHAAE